VLSYKGTNYHGWQVQPNADTVQANIEKALTLLLRQPMQIVGAGRTDAGVHAQEMFAHFDVPQAIDTKALTYKLNAFLPKDIAIHDILPVKESAHARFDATARSYKYFINRNKNPFLTETSWYLAKDLDVNAMNEAAKILLQYDDFKSFSKTHTDVKTFICDVREAYWEQSNGQLIFNITADRFLRNMVRAIVGTLVDVGLHKLSKQDFINIIEAKDRQKAGFSVPAQGLFLTKIEYPSNIFIAYGND
jgi:tRNA pseudouridine38-40 synthase